LETSDCHIDPVKATRKVEVILLAVVLVAAHKAIPYWLLWRILPSSVIHHEFCRHGYGNFSDALSVIMPLLLCLGTATRSGLRLGTWRPRTWRIICVCALPVALTAIVYPFTSQPFTGDRIGCWLISPAAQDLLFGGYLYGLLNVTFPGCISSRVRLSKAALLTAAFFSLWHTPNFLQIGAAFVTFQLLYTFVGCVWILLTRQWTGSILPVVISHMAANFVSWKGW